MTDLNSSRLHHAPNPWALTPLVVFLLSYLVVSIIAGDFYKMPITVAFVIASVVAIAMSKGGKISNRIEQFCRGGLALLIARSLLVFPCMGGIYVQFTGFITGCSLLFTSCLPYSGDYSTEVPPLPIPNREVKLSHADGTA